MIELIDSMGRTVLHALFFTALAICLLAGIAIALRGLIFAVQLALVQLRELYESVTK